MAKKRVIKKRKKDFVPLMIFLRNLNHRAGHVLNLFTDKVLRKLNEGIVPPIQTLNIAFFFIFIQKKSYNKIHITMMSEGMTRGKYGY